MPFKVFIKIFANEKLTIKEKLIKEFSPSSIKTYEKEASSSNAEAQ